MLTGTLYGLVVHQAVPSPISTMLRAKVESRLINSGRPIIRCTPIQYSAMPTTKPKTIITGTAP